MGFGVKGLKLFVITHLYLHRNTCQGHGRNSVKGGVAV